METDLKRIKKMVIRAWVGGFIFGVGILRAATFNVDGIENLVDGLLDDRPTDD